MAKTVIKGRSMAFEIEKTEGSGTYTRFLCVGDVSLDVNTEEVESSACNEDDTESAAAFRNYEPGNIDWSGAVSGDIRRITSPDATTNVSAEEILDMQLQGRKALMRVSIGTDVGAAQYGGTIFFTKGGVTGSKDGNATFSASFRGTGNLNKTIKA